MNRRRLLSSRYEFDMGVMKHFILLHFTSLQFILTSALFAATSLVCDVLFIGWLRR